MEIESTVLNLSIDHKSLVLGCHLELTTMIRGLGLFSQTLSIHA